MRHPEIFQVRGGKKHLFDKDGTLRSYCGMDIMPEIDRFVGHLQSELDLDETFCQNCVRVFWRLYNNGH